MFIYQPINVWPLKPPAFDGNDLSYEKLLCDVGIVSVTPRDKRNP
jgi:hypothetical protein